MTEPAIFTGLLLGAMLPYIFSSFTIRSVGKAAFGMVEEVRRQINADPGILKGTSDPDYKACIAISTRASLYEMIAPGLLVLLYFMLGRLISPFYWFRVRPKNVGWIPPRSYRKWSSNGYFCC